MSVAQPQLAAIGCTSPLEKLACGLGRPRRFSDSSSVVAGKRRDFRRLCNATFGWAQARQAARGNRSVPSQ